MKLKDLVTNLKLSKKLKAKGFPQEQEDELFYWWVGEKGSYLVTVNWTSKPLKRYRAVTAEELLKELIKNQICFELVWHDQKALIRKIWGYRCPVIVEPFESNNFANTLALLWIYLVNKKLLKGE